MSPEGNDDATPDRRPCLSLPHAVCDIARRAGHTIDTDAACAVMGLSLMVPAAPDEPDLGAWPGYARDAFLIPAGQLFGLTIRDIHPPEAARGLTKAGEFRQHFDASYRPLVLRALEHNQPVVAWQGWPGIARLNWGVITHACVEGVGLAGRVHDCGAVSSEHVLERPPVQLYVVETIENRQPEPVELLEAFLANGHAALSNGLKARFGVPTGPAAYDRWIERLRHAGAGDASVLAGHRTLTASTIAAHRSAERFVRQLLPAAKVKNRARLDLVSRLLPGIIEELSASVDIEAGSMTPSTALKALARARDATAKLRSALRPC